jgi:signal peptidase I
MLKRILFGTLKFLLYLIFVGAAVYYTPTLLAKALQTPYPLATITSGSMWPVLKENDLILMRGLSGKDAQIGMIIVYKNPQGFTIHRLVKKDGDKLVTRGDANNIDDTPIASADVIGTVVNWWWGGPVRIPAVGSIARNFGKTINNFRPH